MKSFLAKLTGGIVTEAIMVGGAMMGGWGPCGPRSTPVSELVLAVHMPGLWLIENMHVPEVAGIFAVLGLYALGWGAIWGLVFGVFGKGKQ